MSALRDPAERTATGVRLQTELTGAPAPEPASPYQASWRDFVYAEVWSRPALDPRSRFLISIAGAAGVVDVVAVESYVRGALGTGALTQAELREAALHVAVYSGWSYGGIIDAAVIKVAGEMGQPLADYAPIRAAPWDPAIRWEEGAASFQHHMLTPAPPPVTAYFEGGILNFVFGEMWCREGLDQRARRWLTLVGVGNSSSDIPIRSHVWAAMASGNATRDEMGEFVLQYALHAGWPRASVMQGAVHEQSDRIEKGLSFMS